MMTTLLQRLLSLAACFFLLAACGPSLRGLGTDLRAPPAVGRAIKTAEQAAIRNNLRHAGTSQRTLTIADRATPQPDAAMQAEELRRIAFDKLNSVEQQIAACKLEGMSYSEIAAKAGIPVSTAKSSWARIRKSMQARVREAGLDGSYVTRAAGGQRVVVTVSCSSELYGAPGAILQIPDLDPGDEQ